MERLREVVDAPNIAVEEVIARYPITAVVAGMRGFGPGPLRQEKQSARVYAIPRAGPQKGLEGCLQPTLSAGYVVQCNSGNSHSRTFKSSRR